MTGAGGQLGRDLVDAFRGKVPPGGRRRALYGPEGPWPSGHDVIALDHAQLAVERRLEVLEAIEALRPQIVVHAAAWTAVDACELDPERAFAVNAMGTRHVAEGARRVRAHLVYLSTDYVFDGCGHRPYTEWDATGPASVYGRSKLGGEHELFPGSTVVRTAWVCGVGGANMVKTALRLAGGDGPLRFVDDQRGSPSFTADLAPAVVTLALERLPGTYHVTNQGQATWFELVVAALVAAGHDPERVAPITTAELDPPRPAPRPAYSVLDNAALRAAGLPLLPDWHDGLERLIGALLP